MEKYLYNVEKFGQTPSKYGHIGFDHLSSNFGFRFFP